MQAELAEYGVFYYVFAKAARTTEEFKQGIIAARLNPNWSRLFFPHKDADENPFISGTICSDGPFFWSDYVSTSPAGDRLMRIYGDAKHFGITDGLCIPVYNPGRPLIIVNFKGRNIPKSYSARVVLHGLAIYTYNRLLQLDELKRPHGLSAREADCQTWAAQGKTDWEIGGILGISESTVHWYIENCKRKLAVGTRIQAVVHALQTGAITL